MQDGDRSRSAFVAVPLPVLLGALLALVLPIGVGTTAASAATRAGAFEKAVVRSVNVHREARGLPGLRSSTTVAACYDTYAERGARALQRTGTAAYTVSRASQECPRVALGETLGRMKVRPARLVARWMRDSERRDVLLHRSGRHIAVGAVRNARGVWSVDVYVVEGRRGAEDSAGRTRPDADPALAEPAEGGDARLAEPSEDGGSPGELPAARQEMLDAVNAERVTGGVADLALLACINANAQRHAERMAASGVLAHQSLTEVQDECGAARRVGENVAMNARAAGAAMVEQWMGSAPHRANILEQGHRYVGVGAAQDEDGRWWGVLVFYGAPLG